jgi:chemotaxis protein methyltransferase CheR
MNELTAAVERVTMMQFATERRSHFEAVVGSRAAASGAADVASYVRRVLALPTGPEMASLVDELTIKETTFYRNVPQLEMFASVAVPEIVERRRHTRGPKQLEIWSAACSTGQEVWTLAILTYEALRFLPQWDFRVLGTDISPSALAAAQKGVYPRARLDTVPPQILDRYFDDHGDQIRVKDLLRRKVVFTQHNLKNTFPAQKFDAIFCRNVMIYFSREDQATLAAKFDAQLSPGGFLFVGHSESLQGLGVDFKLRIESRGVAYQKKES